MKTTKNTHHLNNSSSEAENYLRSGYAIECLLPDEREAEDGQGHSINIDTPRTVIRGESNTGGKSLRR